MPFSISGLLSSRETDIGQRASSPGSISVSRDDNSPEMEKKTCNNLFITYFNIKLKITKLTSHTDTKLIWIWVIDIGWAILLWKKSCIDLFIERLDIVLSDFCPDICPWADIAVALPVSTHGQIDVITYTYVMIYVISLLERLILRFSRHMDLVNGEAQAEPFTSFSFRSWAPYLSFLDIIHMF